MREDFRRSGVDALVVLHRGKIVFERYLGDMTAQTQHAAFSATKSLIGLMVRAMVDEGRIDASASKYVPELAGTGVGSATIQQLLDMTVSFQIFGKPRQPGEVDARYLQALGFLPRSADHPGPEGRLRAAAELGTLRRPRHDSFAARGQFGQRLWIAPGAETVIVQLSTDPDASNAQEPLRVAAWQAIADRLAERKH
jgi:CubicO group peptidase (beta-lactamase class C family)